MESPEIFKNDPRSFYKGLRWLYWEMLAFSRSGLGTIRNSYVKKKRILPKTYTLYNY